MEKQGPESEAKWDSELKREFSSAGRSFFKATLGALEKQGPESEAKRDSELKREFSSAGSEHLPYKQRVGGSIPSTPTQYRQGFQRKLKPFLFGLV